MTYNYQETYSEFIKRMKEQHNIDFVVQVESNDIEVTMLHNGTEVVKQTYPMTYLFNHVEN